MIVSKLKDCRNRVESTVDWLKDENKNVVLYGAGYCGHEAGELMRRHEIPIAAICDDFRAGEELDGVRISKIDDVTPNDDTVIFVTSGFNAKMKANLQKLGLMTYYNSTDFGRYDSEKENYRYFVDHRKQLNDAYELLSDEKSRRLFVNLANYRISRDPKCLDGMEESMPQYFPSEPNLDLTHRGGGNEKHTFLDCGAYDGDTIRSFLKYVDGNYEKIIAVEAGRKNFERLKKNLADVPNVEYHNVGVFDRQTQLKFTDDDAKNSFIDESGESVIEMDSIDNILDDKPASFIKMDIEGAEYEALVGAEHTLKKYNPTLAVCVYHKVEDLYRLQLQIENTCPCAYDYYLRHYSPTVIETVLYAVPQCGFVKTEGDDKTMAENIRIDSHKLIYHPCEVARWLNTGGGIEKRNLSD